MIRKTLVINGVTRQLILDQDETLAKVLREHLLLTGCKIGCGEGHCGACNVIVDGKVTKSCVVTKMSRFRTMPGDLHHRRSGSPQRHASAAGRVDGARLRAVRLLYARLHYQRESPSR